jgi:hypothetical protein
MEPTMSNKHVYLRLKSLEKAWAWAEANEDDPLAWAYMSACNVCGVDFDDLFESATVNAPGGGRFPKQWRASCDAEGYALKCRDTIGRLILFRLKNNP